MRINTKYEVAIELEKFLKKVFANLRKACYYRRADKSNSITFFEKTLDHYSVHVHNNQQVAALPQLDRGTDYESVRRGFESLTAHHLNV